MQRENSNEFTLQGLGKTKLPSASRVTPSEEVHVRVLSDQDVFDRFVHEVYASMDARWAVVGRNAALPFTREDYRRYCYTAVKARVSRVNNERFHTRCDDPWALQPVLASVLAGIGVVLSEAPVVTIRPVWNTELDEFPLSQSETSLITRQIRNLELVNEFGLMTAHAIAGGKSGDQAIMRLIPIRSENGALREIRSPQDFDPIAAVAYLIGGLEPEAWDEVDLPSHPLLYPPYYYDVPTLMTQVLSWADVGAGK